MWNGHGARRASVTVGGWVMQRGRRRWEVLVLEVEVRLMVMVGLHVRHHIATVRGSRMLLLLRIAA